MFLIRGKYPIDTIEQVKLASEYFENYLSSFSPSEKMLSAARLEKRAGELGTTLVDKAWIVTYSRPLLKEASESPALSTHMKMRKLALDCHGVTEVEVDGKTVNALELMNKIASSDETVFEKVQGLIAFDKLAGLDNSYSDSLPDPVMTIAGSAINPWYDGVKMAGDLTQYDLKKLACDKDFTEKLASENFATDPCGTVYSMSPVEKENFLRLVE